MAAGLSSSVKKAEGYWIAESPMGPVKIRFTEKNKYFVLDHEVELETGELFYNPLRVLKNGEGSEVVFTLFRRSGMTDQEYREDAMRVTNDLNTLKKLLERSNL